MVWLDVVALIKRFGGWLEGDTARFPSVYQKEQFEKKYEELRLSRPRVQ